MALSSSTTIAFVSHEQEAALGLAQKITRNETEKNCIPWTIINKYYTAHVHIRIHLLERLKALDLQGVPAIVFTWQANQSYRSHVRQLAQLIQTSGADPEVVCAARVQSSTNPSSELEEDSEIDTFLSSKGFEFIDVCDPPSDHSDSNDDGDDLEIPRLPRLLDALSTIMWPSMVSSNPLRKFSESSSNLEEELLGWTEHEHEARGNPSSYSQKKWLPSRSDASKTDPWDATPQSKSEDGVFGSLTTELFPEHSGDAVRRLEIGPPGFDDDFTVFISAPAEGSTPPPQPEPTSPLEDNSRSLSLPMHYSSLGSVSDFGDDEAQSFTEPFTPLSAEDDENDADDADDDDGFPSKFELTETTKQILGTYPTHPFKQKTKQQDGREKDIDKDEVDEDSSAFDFEHVLGELQGMKAQIADISDQTERRRAAARVALGLVYGLEGAGVLEGDGDDLEL